MAMEKAAWQRWWALHLRTARGETLTGADLTLYESGCRQLEADEVFGLQGLDLQASIASLEAERITLEARRQHVEDEIASLEVLLEKGTRQPTGAED